MTHSIHIPAILAKAALALTLGICAEAGAQGTVPVGYTLTLNPNHSGAAIGIYDNVTTTTLPSEVWADHTFYGWAESASGAVAYHAGDEITLTGNKTLYAIWDKDASFTLSAASLSSANFDASGYAPSPSRSQTSVSLRSWIPQPAKKKLPPFSTSSSAAGT